MRVESANDGQEGGVLASAITLFASLGVDGVELAEIARAADVSVQSLEREFGSKEELFRSAVGEAARGHVARACSELPPGSPVEQLRNFCGRSWAVLNMPTHAALERLWVTGVPSYAEMARFYAEDVYGTLHGKLVEIIQRGIAEGQFRPVAPRAAARVILASLVKQASWCTRVEAFRPTVADECNRVVADTLSLLLGGLQPPGQDAAA